MADHLSDFCQERYDYEASRRGELTGAVAIPIGILSVLGGALVAILKDLRPPLAGSDSLLLLAAAASLVLGAVSVFFLARSYFGFTYRYVATPKEVRDYHAAVKNTYLTASVAPELAAYYADEKVLAYIQERYAEAAHHNTTNNDKKSYFLHLANGAMIAALLPAVVAGCAFLYSNYYSPPSAARVEIVNAASFQPKEICCGNRDTQRPASPAASAAARPDPAGAAAGSVHQGASGPN